MTDITTKIKIVDSFYSVARKSIDIKPEIMKGKDVDEFFEYNDLGVPLAVAIVKGTAEPTELGKDVINETYSLLCKLLKVDETLTMNYVEHFWYYVNGEVWEDNHSNNPYRNYDNEFG